MAYPTFKKVRNLCPLCVVAGSIFMEIEWHYYLIISNPADPSHNLITRNQTFVSAPTCKHLI